MRVLLTLRLLTLATLGVALHSASAATASGWLPYGPNGGDARSLAADPTNHAHLYLGTVNGWVYESMDSGGQWKRLARVGKRDDLVIDNIVVDGANAKHVMIGAWSLGGQPDGGIFQSVDGGVSWSATDAMKGQSVLALASAPSDSKTIVAGTLTGIYRSADAGASWQLISPPENKEIHEVESIAIDPVDPSTIYAGTWHLPWKTMDGGKTWIPIKGKEQGIIDDSDVFSIIVDPKNPKIVFASACSGIYKSENSGERFSKIQGIPNTARRTRVLMQDPQHQSIVFAGTTEGLYRTNDSGKIWTRMTGPEVIVNDVFVDPTDSQKVLLATDRGGVLTSADGGSSFTPANTGFSTRQITSFVVDQERSGTMYAGVVNDKTFGGVFASLDGGLSWKQQSDGLNGSDVFSMGQASDGSLLAGTGHGVYRYDGAAWMKTVVTAPVVSEGTKVRGKPALHGAKGTSLAVSKAGIAREKELSGRREGKAAATSKVLPAQAPSGADTIYSMATLGDRIFAGTSDGLIRSDAAGKVWETVPAAGQSEWRFVAAGHGSVAVAGIASIKLSVDAGESWVEVPVPEKISHLRAIALDDQGELWVGSREGVYLSNDAGRSWQTLNNLFVRDVDGLYFDAHKGQLYVTSNGNSTLAFAVNVKDRKVSFWDTGWTMRFVRPAGDHLLGATLFDGIVIQPRLVETKEVASR